MSKETNRFVLSDGNIVNSKGFRIDINGIDLTRFIKNPVMLFEHNRANVIGLWEDIRKEHNKLTAVPKFDTDDAEALSISGKVERGFLKGASMGIVVLETKEIENELVVTKSDLFEASIVTIPSDSGAVRLYNKKLEHLSVAELKLSIKQQNPPQKGDYHRYFLDIRDTLGLEPQAGINDVLAKIYSLMKPQTENLIDECERLGVITETEKRYYSQFAENGQTDVLFLLSDKKDEFVKQQSLKLADLYKNNSDKIITYLGSDGWEKVEKLGFELAANIVEALPERMYLSKMINTDKKEPHDLDWYRKHNPKALRDNPDLYQSLLKINKLNK
ncbi:MAG: hypothetical protein GX963_03030 [Bacteroidales bacterium]|nr:hypothetical protein [Bacteroidales bacterium]